MFKAVLLELQYTCIILIHLCDKYLKLAEFLLHFNSKLQLEFVKVSQKKLEDETEQKAIINVADICSLSSLD